LFLKARSDAGHLALRLLKALPWFQTRDCLKI
jgi:hypothetical protein